jgi:NAD(P)-dependent dehydrogenase (short-subunit alcohol dehydrogenase family)
MSPEKQRSLSIAISGSSSGIGKALALGFKSEGWTVFEIDKDEPAERGAHFLKGDLSKVEDCLEFCRFIKRHTECLDALVNNAGFMIRRSPESLSLEEWNRVLATNLTAPFILTRELAPVLAKGRGRVINICSTRATMSEANTESYSASKGGLLALTHANAVSFGPNLKVNAISPGWIDVEGEELRKSDHSQHPAGRVGKPEDILSLVRYLVSDDSSFVTGAEFIVDGGMTRKMIYED